jgi:2-polyprenyl-3-methyl-5-hydroxy-6-metoxy-1,4-benzoquinol methylase
MADSTSSLNPTLVFVPSLRVDRGMGHLRRCLAAASAAGAGAAVYFAREPDFVGRHPVFEKVTVQALADEAGVRLWDLWPQAVVVPTVVSDLQAAPESAFEFLRARAQRLVGWDEGGPARRRFPFLVDSLPHDSRPDPNVRLPALLGLSVPAKAHLFDRPIRKVLAVFGGADPAGLTLRFLEFVGSLRGQGRWPYTLTVVRGPLSRFIVPPDTEVLEAPKNLPGLLGEYDLVVTSWGLTALEALAAGTPVLLLNPTGYHEQLTRAAGLPSFGLRRPRAAAFWSGIDDAPEAARSAFGRLLQPPRDAGAYFRDFHGSDGRCPVCRTYGHAVFARTEHKSYHRCGECGMEYLSAHQLPPTVYSEAYFFEDYQKQYGKTYLQDFAHIQSLGRERLAFLDATCGTRPGRRVLDAGCAYGPFLAAVAEAGHHPFGLDVAAGAVSHVRDTLGFPAVQASFLDFRWQDTFPDEPLPDVLTLWYVIEHFADLDRLLRQANAVLPPGGVFAFSTPNGQGITRRFQPEKFWRESPDDHFSIWSPRNTAPVLERFGFTVLAYRITGRHPERFPGVSGKSGPRYAAVALLDRLLGWGDTFEVYARKNKELP